MSFKEDVEKIMNSEVFKNLNKKMYLCSCFAIDDDWQYDFYDKKTKNINSFKVEDEIKLVVEESKVFQKEQVDVEKLDLDDVKIKLEEALLKIEKIKKEKCNEEINKKIMILQHIKVPLWNISLLTSSLNILNVRINAVSGEIISEKFESLLNFKVK